MKITSISVSNFKRIDSAKIELGRINYLVGGNNSGKSSILQAIHMAVSVAQASIETGQAVVAESTLRYSPSADFSLLGHRGPYENRSGGSRGSVEFSGETSDGVEAAYRIEMYKARNHHNVGVNRIGTYPGFGQHVVDPARLFSVYVPGLSGIPHREEAHGFAAVFQKAAGGDANLVFRNILRLLGERGRLDELEDALRPMLGPVEFVINFDADTDVFVDVKMRIESAGGDLIPIDLCGTGVIQLTQIFAYVILFQPLLLLVDEPDSHLHPSKQATLSEAFREVSERYGCSVIVSTHSRHMVASAPDEAEIIWLRGGRVETSDARDLATILMDLGALDQLDSRGPRAILCTEDARTHLLKSAVVAAGHPDVEVISYQGVTGAAAASAIAKMAELLPSSPSVVVHRDRDFLTQAELAIWSKEFAEKGIKVFCPELCDVEAYFAAPEHLKQVFPSRQDEVDDFVSGILADHEAALRKKFRDKRREAVRKFWPDGGSPSTSSLWPDGDPVPSWAVYGKQILAATRNRLQNDGWAHAQTVSDHPSAKFVAELKEVLDQID